MRSVAFNRKTNCINLIRLIAALQVMYGHIIVHMEIPNYEIINRVFGYFLGVPIFFILSGFLIWNSIERSKSYLEYIKKEF